jgi:hypothetical protein
MSCKVLELCLVDVCLNKSSLMNLGEALLVIDDRC